MDIYEKLSKYRVVPVIKLDNTEDAVPLAAALIAGGLPCAEITYRTAAATESIRRVAAEFPQMLIGAGTVLTAEQADSAMEAGAAFIVSPGLNPDTVKHCLERGYPVIPGVMTPSEIELALSLGLDTLKFFPAEAAGGLKMIKAVSAPYGMLRFMPTGGISPANLREYLSFDKIIACGGSWMVPPDAVKNKDFKTIERLTAEAVGLAEGIRK